MNVPDKISLKDIFNFDELLSRPDYLGKRIKTRFNKNWGTVNDDEKYLNQDKYFVPYMLTIGHEDSKRRTKKK